MLGDPTVASIHETLTVFTGLCLPLFAAEAACEAGNPPELAAINLAVPLISIAMKYTVEKPLDHGIQQASYVGNIVSIVYFSHELSREFGFLLALVEGVIHLNTRYELAPPTKGYLMALANLCEDCFLNGGIYE